MLGPRLYRFFNYEGVEYIPAPVDGWNPDANPWVLPDTQAPQLDNFLIKPGKIITRGGFAVRANLAAFSPLNVCGAVVTDSVLIARKSAAASGQIDPWSSPLLATTNTVCASGLVGAKWVARDGTITGVTLATVDTIPGPRWINFDGKLYGISYDAVASPVSDTNGTYFIKPLNLLSMAPPTPGSTTPLTSASSTFTPSNRSSGGVNEQSWTFTGLVSPSRADDTVDINHLDTTILGLQYFGFAIPPTATITGIQVSITRRATIVSGSSPMSDVQIQLVKSSGQVGTNKSTGAAWNTTTYTAASFGSTTDLWGTTWTPNDINNNLFGVYVRATMNSPGFPNSSKAQISACTITVSYSLPVNTTPVPSVMTSAPKGAFDLKGYQSRIWLLGGIDTPGAGTTHSPTTLFFTNPIVSGGGSSAADWQDPVSGLTNQIKMDNSNRDFGVGLGVVRNGLVIFRRSSIWLLRGSTTANYSLSPVSQEVGCVDARSIVESDAGVYFMSSRGLMLTDGVRVINVSGSVLNTLQSAVAAEQSSVLSGGGGYVTCGLTTQGQVLVSIGTYSGGSVVPLFTAMYDPAVSKGGAWVRITSQIWLQDTLITEQLTNYYAGPIWTQAGPRQLVTLGDNVLTVLEDYASNFSFVAGSALHDKTTSGFATIPFLWVTKFAPTVGTAIRKKGQVKRFFLDYVFAGTNITVANAWFATPIDAFGNAYGAAGTLVAAFGQTPSVQGPVTGVSLTANPQIQRENLDLASEITDVQFYITWFTSGLSAAPTNVVAELYGVGVESQRTGDLR